MKKLIVLNIYLVNEKYQIYRKIGYTYNELGRSFGIYLL